MDLFTVIMCDSDLFSSCQVSTSDSCSERPLAFCVPVFMRVFSVCSGFLKRSQK